MKKSDLDCVGGRKIIHILDMRNKNVAGTKKDTMVAGESYKLVSLTGLITLAPHGSYELE